MGEVYRARDERLDRFVAIKILATERTTRDAVSRFEREARAASALNHPHILHVYDVGSARVADDAEVHYIAMELVDGETLRNKLELRTDFRQLLEPLIDVAEALAKAHAAGIIHRDLKPENIMITRDGYAKVLDFGLAKLADRPFDANTPTEQFARTATGVVLGTVGYMSPEQVEGRDLDARTDIFSFGCILYEALTGVRAFRSRSAVDTMHKIAHHSPPLTDMSPDLQRIIGKCLAKNPDERYQSIKEVAVDLREVRRSLESGEASPVRRALLRNGWLYVALIAIAFAFVLPRLPRPQPASPAPAPPLPFSSIDIERVTFTGDAASAAISRSGSYLAYTRSANKQQSLWLKQFATGADVQLIPPGAFDFGDVAFSPDENLIYFDAEHDIDRIPIIGGQPQKIISGAVDMVTFSPDGRRLAFIRRNGPANMLVTADLDGGNEQIAYSGEESLSLPTWSPRGNEITCLSFANNITALAAIDLRRHTLALVRQTFGKRDWMPDSTALISPKVGPEPLQQLRYVPYPRGKERRITTDLCNYIGVSLTADGRTIASVQIQGAESIWLLPGGNSSAARQLTPTITGRSDGVGIAWTPNGGLVYYSVDREIHLNTRDAGSNQTTLWSEPFGGILATSPPAVSPDGKWIAFRSHDRGNIWLIGVDGGNRRALTSGDGDFDPQWWPDGPAIAYASFKREGGVNPMFISQGVWRVPISGGAPSVIDAKANAIRISADGRHRLMRYPGSPPILVVSALDGTGAKQLPLPSLTAWNRAFKWSPDGTSIDYVADGRLWRFPVSGNPRKLTNLADGIEDWAWSVDGSQLAVARGTDARDVVLIHDRTRR